MDDDARRATTGLNRGPATRGKILLQSEGVEVDYRNIGLTPLK